MTISICSIGSSLCGNGFIDEKETCDDGNKESGDGCSSFCLIESGFYCEDGICKTKCGDGIIAGFEICDPGEFRPCTETCLSLNDTETYYCFVKNLNESFCSEIS